MIFPLALPPSLADYPEAFDKNANKTILRLRNHLKKRGTDPLGYFLLAFFYLKAGEQTKALRYANAARNFAFGSSSLFYAPHFILTGCFPDPELMKRHDSPIEEIRQRGFGHFDLDQLIAQLSEKEQARIKMGDLDDEKRDLAQESEQIDDIISETLAQILVNQEKWNEAASMYEQLAKAQPKQSAIFLAKAKKMHQKASTGKRLNS